MTCTAFSAALKEDWSIGVQLPAMFFLLRNTVLWGVSNLDAGLLHIRSMSLLLWANRVSGWGQMLWWAQPCSSCPSIDSVSLFPEREELLPHGWKDEQRWEKFPPASVQGYGSLPHEHLNAQYFVVCPGHADISGMGSWFLQGHRIFPGNFSLKPSKQNHSQAPNLLWSCFGCVVQIES